MTDTTMLLGFRIDEGDLSIDNAILTPFLTGFFFLVVHGAILFGRTIRRRTVKVYCSVDPFADLIGNYGGMVQLSG